MSELAKAKLIELAQNFEDEKPGGQQTDVQFNPETLKVTYANSQAPGGDQSAGSAGQFIGSGSTKLALQLWFDCTAMEKDPVDDVRRLTEKVIYFMTPQPSDADATKLSPPGVCFQWGSFLFKGVVEALEQTLEFFSPDGKPLRASISLTLSQQKILKAELTGDGRVPARPGHKPLKAAKQDDSMQKMAGKSGKRDWQSIAAANGIEDPLRMAPGALVDLNASIGVETGLSAGVNAAVGVSGGSRGASLNAALGGAASASLSIN